MLDRTITRLDRAWSSQLSQGDFISRVAIAALAALAACAVNFAAIFYATLRASNWVTDIWLSNIPAYNVAALLVYGTFALIAFCITVQIVYPARIPFALRTLALFWCIRSAFVCLTHIKSFPDHGSIEFSVTIARAFFGDDLFFSAHTGVPLLAAFVYWHQPVLRGMFFAWTAFFAVVVLLGHFHYSNDVAAAFFITVPIYLLATRMFREDEQRRWQN